jgi:hypothetical protein
MAGRSSKTENSVGLIVQKKFAYRQKTTPKLYPRREGRQLRFLERITYQRPRQSDHKTNLTENKDRVKLCSAGKDCNLFDRPNTSWAVTTKLLNGSITFFVSKVNTCGKISPDRFSLHR